MRARSSIPISAPANPLTATRPRLWTTLATVSAAVVAAHIALRTPVLAQSSVSDEETFGQGLEPFEADGPLLAVVSTRKQTITVWDRNGVIATSPVSTGRNGFETPEGVFSIIERKVEHNSNLYDDAEMPFMQRLTWTGVALHQGNVPGYRASHGCIRLPEDFAERLFRTTKIATRVVITSHAVPPQSIRHPALLQPSMMSLLPDVLKPDRATRAEPASYSPTHAPDDGQALRLEDPEDANAVTIDKRPSAVIMQELRVRHAEVGRQVAAATRVVNAAKTKVRPRLLDQGQAEKGLRQASAMARRAQGRVEAIQSAVNGARSDGQRGREQAALEQALTVLADAKKREADANEFLAQKIAAALAIKAEVLDLESKRLAVINESRKLWRRMQPVSVLISRETGRIYVRRAFHAVADFPISIRDAARPLGTHVFTALSSKEVSEELNWTGLTLLVPEGGDPPGAREEEPPSRKRGRRREADTKIVDSLASARAALERITIPPEALARILPSLQAGSTIILSDRGPSIETGPGTDLVVQTKGEQAAKESIARFLAKKRDEQLASDEPSSRFERRGERRPTGDWQRW